MQENLLESGIILEKTGTNTETYTMGYFSFWSTQNGAQQETCNLGRIFKSNLIQIAELISCWVQLLLFLHIQAVS